MSTRFKYRGMFLIPAAYKDDLNEVAKAVLDGEGGQHTFTNWASTTGNSPPSHYYACSALTEEAVQQIKNISVSFPLAKAWVWVDHETGNQQFLNQELGGSNITTSEIDFDDMMSTNNLKRGEEDG